MRQNWTSALEQRVRAADPTARIMVELRAELSADVRQRFDQWNNNPGLDSIPATVELIPNGGVRLKATASNGPVNTTQNSYARSKLDSGATAPFMDPPAVDGQLRLFTLVQWGGNESTTTIMTQVQAWLHPRFDASLPKTVARWRCDVFAAQGVTGGGLPTAGQLLTLAPTVGPVYADAVGQSAGFVTFDFTGLDPRPLPKSLPFKPVYMVLVFTGWDAGGNPARNIGLGYDNAHDSVTSAAGSTMAGREGFYQASTLVLLSGTQHYVPTVKIILATHTTATVGFTGTANQINVGNLIPDGSFEAGVSQVHDVTGSGLSAGPTQDGTHAWDGASGCKFTTVATANVGVSFSNLDGSDILVVAGRSYELTVYVFATGAAIGKLVHGTISWLDRTRGSTGGATGGSVTLASGWNIVQVTGVAPTGTSQCYPALRQDGANAVQYWIDGAQFAQAAQDVEFVLQTETPPGTSLTATVSADGGANYVAFTDGQTASQLGLPNQLYYKMQATLTTDGAGANTPILRGLGARNVTRKDFSDVAWVERVAWRMDPTTHKAEIPELVLRAIRDGERDFHARIEDLLSTYRLRDLLIRLWCGDSTLPRAQWVHLDDFLIDDYDPRGSDVAITAVSPLVLIRGALPRLTDEQDAVPNADVSNAGAWVASNGSILFTNLSDQAGVLPWDDSTWIQSPLNPVNAACVIGLSAIGVPQNPDGTSRLAGIEIEYRLYLLSGTSLTITTKLKQAGTDKAADGPWTLNASSGVPVTHIFRLTPNQLLNITNWSQLQLEFKANGTGKVAITFARLAVLPMRLDLNYGNALPSTVVDDLLTNQLIDIDARFRGPNLSGIPGLGTGTNPLTIGKVLSSPPGGATDLSIAKNELDAIAFDSGGFFHSVAGKITYTQLYTVLMDAVSGNFTFDPIARIPVAFIPMEELAEPISVGPGFRLRIPEFTVPWGFDFRTGSPTVNSYQGEAHGTNATALDTFGLARIDAPRRLDDIAAKWIQSQGHANGIAARHTQMFGVGFLKWGFRTTYAHPELQLGDTIAVQSDRFLGWDPTADQGGRALSGPLWAVGIVIEINDAWGRDLAIWIPSYTGIGGGRGPVVGFQNPIPAAADIVINGDFENGLARWQNGNGAFTVSLETASANTYNGVQSLKIDAGGVGGIATTVYQVALGTPVPGGPNQALIRVVPGMSLIAYGVGKWNANTGGQVAHIGVDYFDAGGAFLSSANIVSWTTETTYTGKSASVTIPDGVAYAALKIDATTAAGATQFWIDEVHAISHGALPTSSAAVVARAATL